jgi:hypothetical protein
VLRNGQLLILRDGQTYSVLGQLVDWSESSNINYNKEIAERKLSAISLCGKR